MINELDTSLLQSCDKEPVESIGSIQPHGFLLVFSLKELKVVGSSENAALLLGDSSETIVGARLALIIGPMPAQAIVSLLRAKELGPGQHQHLELQIRDREYLCHIYRIGDDQFGLEFESDSSELSNTDHDREFLSGFAASLQGATDVRAIGQMGCAAIRRLTGLERVMLYRFSPSDWHGEVIAEDRIAGSHAFLDHRFPADDIPRPARELYLRNRMRFIHDSHGVSSAVNVQSFGKKVALDLSDSRLRGVSPIHLEYLRNMGVRTSFSLAVIIDQKLWGLFACHHSSLLKIDPARRLDCLTIANICAAFSGLLEQNEVGKNLTRFSPKLFRFIHDMMMGPEPVNELFRQGQRALDLFRATGMAIVRGPTVDVFGMAPPTASCFELARIVRQRDVSMIDRLSDLGEEWTRLASLVCGVAAVSLDDTTLMLFRPEKIRAIKWGGNPHKSMASRNYEGKINPRASFETWTETVRETSESWAPFELDGLCHLRDIVLGSSERRQSLARELQGQLNR